MIRALLLLAFLPLARGQSAASAVIDASPLPTHHRQGVLTVNTTAALRHALAHPPPDGRIELRLPEGNVYNLSCMQLAIHNIDATLRSEGAGALLDAGGYTRHFDVALGGRLHLEHVHLINGGGQVSGGAALVRFGGELSAVNVVIEDGEAVKQGGAVAVQDHNALEKIRVASSGTAGVNMCLVHPPS